MNPARPHVLLLAAGNASRYGSAKQVEPIDGLPMVRRAADAATAAGLPLTVVTGAWRESVETALAGHAAALLHNSDWERGMGSSIARGVRHLLQSWPDPGPVIICLADQPLVGEAQLRALTAAHLESPHHIVAADHGGLLGPPCLFPRDLLDELTALDGAQGAKPVLNRHAARVLRLPMPEAAIDIDTPEQMQRLKSRPGPPR